VSRRIRRVVCYSIAVSPATPASLYWQIEASVTSLRMHDPAIAVSIFVYGSMPPEIERRLSRLNVAVKFQGAYIDRLAELMPRGSTVLAQYPVIHRFLNLRDVATWRVDQALFLDVDTFFVDDPGKLFDKYHDADFYAREEPGSRRDARGYEQTWIDEDALDLIAREEGVTLPAPMGLGVVLLNGQAISELAQRVSLMLDYAWRFLVWMATNELEYDFTFSQGRGVEYLVEHFEQLTTRKDFDRRLAFPSGNRWLLEDPSVWFAIGHTTGLACADLSSVDVRLGGEFDLGPSARNHGAVVVHYYTHNLIAFEPVIRALGFAGALPSAGWPVY
jgi:hypothetical protein